MASKNGIDRRDEDGELFHPSYAGEYANTPFDRGLPRLQVLAVSQPEYAISHQPRMLPQDVRVLRRPNILLWTR